jgi:YhcH/YjgK/YiaL family protein
MIFDKIENSAIYENINPFIKIAFDYLKQTNFSLIDIGKHIVDGDNIFAIVQEYETRNNEDVKLEAHKKYIDVQYVVSGEEFIGVCPLIRQIPVKVYDVDNDYALYEDSCSFIKIKPKQFAILFPQDLHKPGIKINTPIKVRKVVVKVRTL